MNELLGWYGYDKVEVEDTEHLQLKQFEDKRCKGLDSEEEDDKDHGRDSVSNASADSDFRLDISSPGRQN